MSIRRLVTLALVGALAVPSAAAAAEPASMPVTTAEGAQYAPDISGRTVVWEDTRWGYDDLWSYDLGTGAEQRLSDAPGRQGNAAISGNTVIAEDGRNGVTTNLFRFGVSPLGDVAFNMTGLYDRYEPAIAGKRVAWKDGRSDFNVYFATLDGSVPPTPVTLDGYYQGEPAISETWVVWRDERLSAGANGDIYGYQFSTGTAQAICADPAIQRNPAISEEWVVWDDYRNDDYDIYAFNLATQSESVVCTATGGQTYPDVSGRWVVWQDDRNGDYDIYAYDLIAHEERAVCTEPGDQTLPAVSGDWVVWQDGRAGAQTDIYAASLVPVADLSASGLSAPTAARIGQAVTFTATLSNHGDGSSAACSAAVYLSADGSIDKSDRRIGVVNVPTIAAGGSTTIKIGAQVPTNLAPGSYRVGVAADSAGVLAELDETDNATFAAAPLTVSRPANDSFWAPASITGVSGVLNGGLTWGATRQVGEPKHAGVVGGSSVWYRWVAPSTGRITIDLAGSSFDTLLGVYTGSAVSTLTKIAGNDDVGARLTSAVTFSAVKGKAYYIAVDGAAGAAGSVKLSYAHRAELTTPSTPTTVRKRTTFSTTGYLKPRHTAGSRAVTLYYERKEAGTWRVRKTVTVKVGNYSTYSRYSLRTTLPSTGSWRVRAGHRDSTHAQSYSAYRAFTVR